MLSVTGAVAMLSRSELPTVRASRLESETNIIKRLRPSGAKSRVNPKETLSKANT